jgi:hypothetical protein
VSGGRLRLAPDEADQVPRLMAFRAAHPEVVIGEGEFGTWMARWATPNDGEQVTVQHTLRELLDKLYELFGEPS